MKGAIVGAIGAAAVAIAGLAACSPAAEVGRKSYAAYYQDFCAGCHGATGRGDGPAAAGMRPPPANLTQLSAENGGTFPMVRVMSQIDGYRSGPRAMPEFGALLVNDRTVMVETAPGSFTPAPERLAGMAEYIESLQRP